MFIFPYDVMLLKVVQLAGMIQLYATSSLWTSALSVLLRRTPEIVANPNMTIIWNISAKCMVDT